MKTLLKNSMLAIAAVGLFIGSASVASADNFRFLDPNMDREVLHPGQAETWRFDLLNDRLVGGVKIDANDIITRAAVAINFFSISVNIRNAERSQDPLGVRGVALFGTFEEHTADNDNGTDNPVPEPATMLLFGTGLAGLAGFGRKKMKQ